MIVFHWSNSEVFHLSGSDLSWIWKSIEVNIQDFLQVFQGSGIRKMEDDLTSADPYLIQLMDPE